VLDELVLGGHGGEGADRSCVEILSDMRMTAYSVDVMISRQPDPTIQQQQAAMPMGLDMQNPVGNGDMQGDLVDVFSWFNFPRVSGEAPIGRAGVGQWAGPQGGEEVDWLFHV